VFLRFERKTNFEIFDIIYKKEFITLIFSLLNSFFSKKTPKEPEPIPNIDFSEPVGLPMICCFNSEQITPLMGVCGTPSYPFDIYCNIVVKSKPKDGIVDIREIDSLSSSKSDTKYFSTLEDFGSFIFDDIQRNSPHELKGWTIEACKKHTDSDLFRPSTQLERIRWNGRTELKNSGGSHHFGVARYLISQGELYPGGTQIELPIFERYIDSVFAERAFKDWHYFIVHEKVLQSIQQIYEREDFNDVSMCRISLNNKDNKDRIIAVNLKDIETNFRRQNLLDELITASRDETCNTQYRNLISKKCIDMNTLILDALVLQQKNDHQHHYTFTD